MNLGKRAAMVVAHPDDETLWGGGLLARRTDVTWTVIACSIPRRDDVRAYKFFQACERLGVRGRNLCLVEQEPYRPLDWLERLGDLHEFDAVVTHGADGEYGHFHHKQVHQYVASQYQGRIYTFAPNGDAAMTLELTDAEWAAKLHALKAYDHQCAYEGEMLTKWEALLHRYGTMIGYNLRRESYHEHAQRD